MVTVAFTQHSVYAQNKIPEIYLNHLYIVLDSTTYNQLFDAPLMSQKLGNTKTSSITTSNDSWSGKYLYGKNGYFEFFTTNSYKGATLGDCGIAFMTVKANDIWKIESNWKETTNDSVERDTTIYMADGKPEPWFYTLNLSNKDSIHPFSVWLMENTTEELKATGFSDEELKNKIKWEEYSAKRSKKEFTKSFDRINAIELSVNSKELEHLHKSLLGFGLTKKGETYFNNQIKIKYSINEGYPVRLKTVETELSEKLSKKKIKISNNLVLHVNGRKAKWEFIY